MTYLVWGKFAGLAQDSLRVIFNDPGLIHVFGYSRSSIESADGGCAYNNLAFESESFFPSIYCGEAEGKPNATSIREVFEYTKYYVILRSLYYSLVNQVFKKRGALPAGVSIQESLGVDIDRATQLLESNNIKTIVFGCIPHDIFDVVLYYVARSRQIECIVFKDSAFIYGTKVFVNPCDNWPHSVYSQFMVPPSRLKTNADIGINGMNAAIGVNVARTDMKIGKSLIPREDSLILRISYSESYGCKKDSEKHSKAEIAVKGPFDRMNRIFRYPASSIVEYQAPEECSTSELNVGLENSRPVGRSPNIRFSFSSSLSSPPSHEEFAFLTVNFQPEATTTVLGSTYEDTLLFVRRVLEVLPDDMILYIKDHPLNSSELGYCRNLDRWLPYAYLDRVRFIDITSDTSEWINSCTVLVCVMGSSGIEALSAGKPVIFGGEPEYKDFYFAKHISCFFLGSESPSNELRKWVRTVQACDSLLRTEENNSDAKRFCKEHFKGYTYMNPLNRGVPQHENALNIADVAAFVRESLLHDESEEQQKLDDLRSSCD